MKKLYCPRCGAEYTSEDTNVNINKFGEKTCPNKLCNNQVLHVKS